LPVAEPAGLAAPATVRYFEALHKAFELAASRAGLIERDLIIAGRRIRLAFAGGALAPLLVPALAHLESPESGEAEARICVWDDQSTGLRIPGFPWSALDVRQQGMIAGYNSERIRTVYHGNVMEPPLYGFNALSMFDAESRTALFWVASRARVPWYEPVEPLRPSLHWALSATGRHFAHAAAVATEHGCVLLAGQGWAGKTTTAMACVEYGFGFLGDNYVVVSVDGSPVAHSLFCNAKLRPESLALLPELESVVTRMGMAEDEKLLVDFRIHRPGQLMLEAPVKALLVVQQMGAGATRVRWASPGEGLIALAPSTIYQLPSNGGAGLRPMADLARRVPTYVLELGPDPASAPPVIADLLRGL
jgi:hypothetical protein